MDILYQQEFIHLIIKSVDLNPYGIHFGKMFNGNVYHVKDLIKTGNVYHRKVHAPVQCGFNERVEKTQYLNLKLGIKLTF